MGEGYNVERGGGCFRALACVRPTEIVLQAAISEPVRGMQEAAKSAVLRLLNSTRPRPSEI